MGLGRFLRAGPIAIAVYSLKPAENPVAIAAGFLLVRPGRSGVRSGLYSPGDMELLVQPLSAVPDFG